MKNQQSPIQNALLETQQSRHSAIAFCSGMIALAITWVLLSYIAR